MPNATNDRAHSSASGTLGVALDSWHAAVVDAVMVGDRARADAGERSWIRAAVAHEFCVGGPCVTWPDVVIVTAIAPGLRSRRPIVAQLAAA